MCLLGVQKVILYVLSILILNGILLIDEGGFENGIFFGEELNKFKKRRKSVSGCC